MRQSKTPKPGSQQQVVGLHPAAKIFNEWLNTEEGKACTEGVTIGAELHGHYMDEIIREMITAMKNLGAKSDLLGIVCSYSETLSDEDVLKYLKEWNAYGPLGVAVQSEGAPK